MSAGWRRHWLALCALGLLLGTMAATVQFILRRTAWITLPQDTEVIGAGTGTPIAGRTTLLAAEITPHTVRSAVATLSRPASYSRTVRITQFWNEGRGSYEAAVSVSDGWTRIDLEQAAGGMRHTLTNGAETYLWQGDGGSVFHAPAGNISADNEQHIPTYEEVVLLSEDQIRTADYQLMQQERCVYVEAEDGDYLRRYWISVDTGLLTAAETLEHDTIIYRMESFAIGTPEPAAFLLPDGTDVRESSGGR